MAADRLQIVLAAKDEISQELKQTKANMRSLGREAKALADRMEAGEQGLQNEYEQTRRELEKNRLKQIELGRAASKTNSEIRELTTDATAGAKRMDRSFDGTRRSIDRTHTASKKLSSGWGKAMGVFAAVTGAIAAMGGAFNFLTSSIGEARAARKALAQTDAVMRSMGRTDAPEKLTRMIDRLEELSGIDGDNIREMTNVLLTFGNVTGKTFDKANALALDLSVAFGKDLQSSAVMVGKALNDPAKGLTALTRIGVQFTDQQVEQVKAMLEVGDLAGAQKIILKELTRQVSGSAAAQADGIGKASVAWGNLKEAIGETLMAVGTGSVDIANSINSITQSIKRNRKAIVATLQGIIGWSYTLISVWLKVASTWLKVESVVLNGLGYLAGALAQFTEVLEFLGLVEEGTADTWRDMANRLRGAGDAAGNASKKFDDQAKKAGALGESIRTAASRTRELNEALKRIKNKEVRVNVRTTINDVWAAVDAAVEYANRFAGGPVTAGRPYMVGELGPELFKPLAGPMQVIGADGPEIRDFHQSGTVIPNHLIAPAVTVNAPAPAPVAVAPSGGVHIENMVVQDRFDARRELTALMRREERIRRERS